jgi:STE24 endopeptidase
MQFLLLLLFGLISWQNAQSQPGEASLWAPGPQGLTPAGSAALTWGAVVAAWFAAHFIERWFAWRLAHAPSGRHDVFLTATRARRFHAALVLCGFVVLLTGCGWGRFVEDHWPWPGAEIVMLSPLLAALVLAWERFYRLECLAAGSHFISKANFLLLQLRNHLLIVVPPAFLWLVQEIVESMLPPAAGRRPLFVACYFAILALALVCLPLLLRLFLGLRPLPAGPLRDRLTEAARRLRFRCGNILVWDTHRTMANALISGFLPWPRYVILTDRLLEELTPDETEAVFAHEVGHVRHHHMALYVIFCLSSLVLLGAAGGYFRELAGPYFERYAVGGSDPARYAAGIAGALAAAAGPGVLALPVVPVDPGAASVPLITAANVVTVLGVAFYFVVVFGFLSRHCERQADLFGAAATSSDAFIGALERVALVNGIPREQGGWFRSWRHPSIAERVAFVRLLGTDPQRQSRFHRSLRLFKWGLAMSLPGLLAVLWWLGGADKVWALVGSL